MFCPPQLREGSDCYAEGWVLYSMWLMSFGVSLSAVFVVALPAIIAPNYKYTISLCAFLIGVFCATLLGVITKFYVPLVCCLVVATITFYIVVHLTSSKTITTFGRAKARPF